MPLNKVERLAIAVHIISPQSTKPQSTNHNPQFHKPQTLPQTTIHNSTNHKPFHKQQSTIPQTTNPSTNYNPQFHKPQKNRVHIPHHSPLFFLYCSPIWGLSLEADQLEQPQCQFWKRLLRLPKSTPGYVVRLETGSQHTSLQMVKATLRLICKILQKDDNTLLAQCLKWQLRWEPRISSAKRSWAKQLKKWLNLTEDGYLLSQPYDQLKNVFPEQKQLIIGKLTTFLLNKHTLRMTDSAWTPDYSKIKTHASTEKYLLLDPALPAAQTLAQTRVNLHRIVYKDKVAPLQDKAACPWCSLGKSASTTIYSNATHSSTPENFYKATCPQTQTPKTSPTCTTTTIITQIFVTQFSPSGQQLSANSQNKVLNYRKAYKNRNM
ncbi:hypothetical protein Fcan01_25891 [Folsomia candida]|uniref:Uncharacterized protein n=1 Tax=Folsomia candida TaxID=158441 RepID=A0A226D176_FOLCA|nr:hypothetical protein Fcan01_25891 [Folsomia candida]